ncbi:MULTISPECIES: LCP family protein [unclassified Staphylococcus]|uniref:LCP family protein n=1 Tax=unclassified Staphylococcus TaxID=91994 RepID=UPI001880E721|nr:MULTISPECIES: LCP family protein [unclassified Staphylococcus]MBF2756948.1 LCP family protein [Staphylococcus haemolyticus]MBF2773003.1 LCP family protein [Staphylococcus haemolyticus]MBF2775381.1 LCP family protein [Staphylococcus haemolyticus]MBF2814682.1 LCP family protein [Staphylococcus haemolyticus]MBF9720840.1 LCP family protein [Staphylococcus haemolyticus]
MNRFLKYFMMLLTLVLIVVPVIFIINLYKTSESAMQDSYDKTDSKRQSSIREGKVNPSKDAVSILFLGIDDNEGRRKNGQTTEHSRTDSMILSTFSPDKRQIRLLSIPRDTISYIPKVGYYDKITHAHAYGGPVAAMDSVEATLNVPVDYYVRVNMDAFVEAVDELGGIYYDVPYDLNEPNTDDSGRIKIKKGYQKLNGDEALAVARTRHHDSDLKRGERQMDLIKLLFQKAKSLDSYDKLDDLVKIVGKNAKHNLTASEIKSLASMYLSDDIEFKTSQLKGEDDYLQNIYYYNPSVSNIMKYSNILRSDLGLSKITDKDDFLDQRVINHYGTLVPLTPLDQSLLKNNQKDTSSTDDSTDNSASNDNTTETQSTETDNSNSYGGYDQNSQGTTQNDNYSQTNNDNQTNQSDSFNNNQNQTNQLY